MELSSLAKAIMLFRLFATPPQTGIVENQNNSIALARLGAILPSVKWNAEATFHTFINLNNRNNAHPQPQIAGNHVLE